MKRLLIVLVELLIIRVLVLTKLSFLPNENVFSKTILLPFKVYERLAIILPYPTVLEESCVLTI